MINRFESASALDFSRSINNFKSYIEHFAILLENDPIARENAQNILYEMSAEMDKRLSSLN